MAASTVNTNKPIIPRGVDDRPVDKYNRAELYSGKALDFDGVNDSVNCGDFDGASFGNGTTDTPCSIVSYFYLDVADRARVLGKHTEWVFGTNNLNEFNFSILDGTGTANQIRRAGISALPYVGKWVHMVATYDGSSSSSGINVYINGVLSNGLAEDVGSYVATQNTAANVYVGLWSVDSRYLNGKVSGTKIFNTALTAAQVADLYNNPEKIVPAGVSDSALKLWLPMMEGAGTTAYDGSGNGNHGTISGATWTHGIGAPVSQTAVIDWNKGVNLMVYSEQFDNAAWTGSAYSVTANATTAPDGQTTADEITFATTLGDIQDQFVNVANETHIASCWFKNGTIGQIFFEVIGGTPGILGQATINLATGTLSDQVGSFTPIIEAYANGWYRVAVGDLGNATIASPSVKIKQSGGNTGTFYIWGAQVEASDSLGAYIPNHTGTPITSDVLLPQGLTSGRDITGVNLFENVRKQGALNLDGNSWAEVHDNASLDITDAVSVECWYYHVDQNTTKGIFGKWIASSSDRSYTLYMDAANKIAFTTSDDGGGTLGQAIATTSFTDDNWYHILGTFDGSSVKIYVNGTLERTTAASGSIYNSDAAVAIGHINGNLIYDQPIAQPRIYNRALTAEEVARNYDSNRALYK